MSISSKIVKAAKPRERDVRKYLKARVESYGGTVNAVKFLDENGAPDVLCQFPPFPRRWVESQIRWHAAQPGRTVWVETKMGKDGHLSKDQVIVIDRLRTCGQTVLVLTTINEVDAWLPELPF